MQIEVIKEEGRYREIRVTLGKGETHECAASTKKVWVGPGTFRRTTWPDGARDDHQETARLTYGAAT